MWVVLVFLVVVHLNDVLTCGTNQVPSACEPCDRNCNGTAHMCSMLCAETPMFCKCAPGFCRNSNNNCVLPS